MCWVALDRAAKLAEIRGDPELRHEVARDGRGDPGGHPRARRRRTAACFASTTRPTRSTRRCCSRPIFGFLPGDDERLHATVRAIAEELTENGFVLRYRTDETDDGLSGKEGTFLICSFWLVSALAIVGELQQARDLMERLLRIASPLGLYAEEFDADTGRHLGNFPQAFSHLALIEAAGADHRRPRLLRRSTVRLMDAYDVIIIGTGAGGGTLARHLAPSGKRILLLERGDWLPREPQNWLAAGRLRRQPLRLAGHLVRREGQAVPAADPLLRRRRDEALRRRALPAARGGLRRASPPRRHLARVADLLRRARAVLHAGRAALPGARRARRGSDRAARERAVPVPGGLARAAHPAARRRSRGGRLPPVPRAVRDPARRGEPAVQPRASAARTATASPASCTRSRTRRCSACGPALEHTNVTLLTNAHVVKLETDEAGTAVTGVVVEHDGDDRDGTRPTSSSLACGAANTAKLLLLSANDKHPNGLANGSDQVGRNYMFHDSQAVLALSREENPTVFQKTLGLNDFYFGERRVRVPAREHPDGRQVAGADVPRREAAARRSSRRSGRSSASRGTRSTSGSRPRICRCPRTASRSTATASSRSSYTADERRAEEAALDKLESMLGKLDMNHGPPVPPLRLHEERDPGRRRARTRRARAASAPTRRRRRSTSTAVRTSWTTSTSSTRASSRASAR